jgi:hypothetical protein
MSHGRTRSPSAALVAGALLVSTSAAHAKATPELACQAWRATAAGKYAQCAQKALAKFGLGNVPGFGYVTAAGVCVTKYAAT